MVQGHQGRAAGCGIAAGHEALRAVVGFMPADELPLSCKATVLAGHLLHRAAGQQVRSNL
jgi:hypothetical protein